MRDRFRRARRHADRVCWAKHKRGINDILDYCQLYSSEKRSAENIITFTMWSVQEMDYGDDDENLLICVARGLTSRDSHISRASRRLSSKYMLWCGEAV